MDTSITDCHQTMLCEIEAIFLHGRRDMNNQLKVDLEKKDGFSVQHIIKVDSARHVVCDGLVYDYV